MSLPHEMIDIGYLAIMEGVMDIPEHACHEKATVKEGRIQLSLIFPRVSYLAYWIIATVSSPKIHL
jgi:hypothetical protein